MYLSWRAQKAVAADNVTIILLSVNATVANTAKRQWQTGHKTRCGQLMDGTGMIVVEQTQMRARKEVGFLICLCNDISE